MHRNFENIWNEVSGGVRSDDRQLQHECIITMGVVISNFYGASRHGDTAWTKRVSGPRGWTCGIVALKGCIIVNKAAIFTILGYGFRVGGDKRVRGGILRFFVGVSWGKASLVCPSDRIIHYIVVEVHKLRL